MYHKQELAFYPRKPIIKLILQFTACLHSRAYNIYLWYLVLFSIHKGAPIMLEILPIVPSSTSQKIYPLFLFYAFIITYYSHKIISGYIACRQFWSCKTVVSQCKCCWCSSETNTVRGCIAAERSIYSNRTVNSPVITGLLTVLLEYIDLSAEHSQQLLPQPQPSDTCTKLLLSHHVQNNLKF